MAVIGPAGEVLILELREPRRLKDILGRQLFGV